jgi:hypothetical protein
MSNFTESHMAIKRAPCKISSGFQWNPHLRVNFDKILTQNTSIFTLEVCAKADDPAQI